MQTSGYDGRSSDAYRRIQEFLNRYRPPTPCLVLDLQTVRERYLAFRRAFGNARIFYAVKANPAPEILSLLASLGCDFDVASLGEARRCLAAGANPEQLSYTNTIKKRADIAQAYTLGIRLFTTDSEQDLMALAQAAPGAHIWCRVWIEPPGSATPFGKKFGCSSNTALNLLQSARTLGLIPDGISFHVGSQQLDPDAWDVGIAEAARVLKQLEIAAPTVNLGGGFPTSYRSKVKSLTDFSQAIQASLQRHFGELAPRIALEPGRALVSECGVIRSEVIRVSQRSIIDRRALSRSEEARRSTSDNGNDRRWVYLDIGRYGGLAETEGEAIAYQLVTEREGPMGDVIIAGPTADGDDVLYQRTHYALPMSLSAGDYVDWLSAGAYTAAYSSVAFNGLDPLQVYVVPLPD